MPDDIDIGVAFVFFWGMFLFVGFVIVVSILQALFEYFIPTNKTDDDDTDFISDIEDYLPDEEEQ